MANFVGNDYEDKDFTEPISEIPEEKLNTVFEENEELENSDEID